MANELTAWVERWQAALDTLTHPLQHLTPPEVAGAEPAEVLQAVLQVRQLLGVSDAFRSPGPEAAAVLASRIYSPMHKDDLIERITEVVARLDQRLAAAVARLEPAQYSDQLIRTSDFTDLRLLSFPEWTQKGLLTGQPEPLTLACGAIDSLAENHPLRALVANLSDGWFEMDRSDDKPARRALLLGRLVANYGGQGVPKPVYHLPEALRLTRELRARQVEKLAEQERRDREDERRKQQEFWASEEGKLKLAAERLKHLERTGQVPALNAPAPPAIRVGRN